MRDAESVGFRGVAVAAMLVLALVGLVNRRLDGGSPQGSALEPAVGRLLIARARLPDPNFAAAVVLLITHGADEGTLGVVLNRPSALEVQKAFPDDDIFAGRDDALYRGGPVSLETIIVLREGGDPPGDAIPILRDVYLVRDDSGLEELLAARPPAQRVRFYAGYAGWSPGQLEDEIERGVWGLLSGDKRWIFSPDPGELWERLTRILFGPRA